MKVLFLALLLGLVCSAQEEEAEQSVSELTGKWITVYIASTNPEKIAENGPFRIKFLKIETGETEDTIIFDFCIERDGRWEKVHITGKKTDDGTYVFEYEGTTEFTVKYASDNVLVVYVSNTDEEGNVTELAAILVKVNIEVEALDTFYARVKEKGIEEKCILKIIKSDDCPPCGKQAPSKPECK